MSKTDRILVRTGDADAIRRRVIDLSGLCTHTRPVERTARITKEAEGLYSLVFSEALAAAQFTNLVGHLLDAPEVTEATGWITGANDVRYELRPDPDREALQETQVLVGVSHLGSFVELYLPECWMCEVSRPLEVFDEPSFDIDADPILEWQVTMDGERHPLLTTTHPKDYDWSDRG